MQRVGWEPKGGPPKAQEIAGLIKGLLTIGFPLYNAFLGPAISWGWWALGGSGPLGSHEVRFVRWSEIYFGFLERRSFLG